MTTHNPGLATVEEMRESGEAQPVIVNEGLYDTSLIHGSCSTRRCVGAQEQNLMFRQRTRAFDHGRRQRVPMINPACQTLEAVNDFVRAVLPGRDTDGQFGS
jgi:hypothetical protein